MKYTVALKDGSTGTLNLEAGDCIREQLGEPVMIESTDENGCAVYQVGELAEVLARKEF